MGPTGMQLVTVVPYCPVTDFEKWLRALERYMIAVDVQGPARRCAVLLHLVGPDITDVSDSLPEEAAEGEEEDEFARLKKKLTRYLVPKKNVVAERGKFQAMKMELVESLDEFLGRLRTQILRCGYEPAQVDRELRDRCVLGSRGELQRKLVREAALKGDDLSLEDVRRTARAHRDVVELTTRLSGAPVPAATAGETVQVVRRPQRTQTARPAGTAGPGTCFGCGGRGHWRRDCPTTRAGSAPDKARSPAAGAAQQRGVSGPPGPADGGRRDSRRGGPHETRRCFKCGRTGHLKRDCPGRGQVASVEMDQVGVVMTVAQRTTQRQGRLPLVTVSVNGRQMEMLVDTGSPVSMVADGAAFRG